jgi:hypothetical protein
LGFTCVFWLLSLFLFPPIVEAPAPRARVLNPTPQWNIALASTAELLTGLQDQLSERMSQHHVIMNGNLDTFTATLTSLTADADLAVNYAQFIHKVIISLGASGTAEEWQENADSLIAEAEKLNSITLSSGVRQHIEAITQIAGTIAAELADMEIFMQNTSTSTNSLVETMGMMLKDQDEYYRVVQGRNSTESGNSGNQLQQVNPKTLVNYNNVPLAEANSNALLTHANEPIAEALPRQPLQWSWDQLDADGTVRRSVGEFTPEQQQILQCKQPI